MDELCRTLPAGDNRKNITWLIVYDRGDTLPTSYFAKADQAVSTCAFCGIPITDCNNSREHIVPAAIGGHHTVSSFICASCNSQRGETWDAELAAQLNWFSVALNIKRERGDAPRQSLTTIAGRRYWLRPDGSMQFADPPVRKEKTESGYRFSFSVSTMEMARAKLEEIARKYPEVNPEEVLATAQRETHYVEDPIMVDFTLTDGSQRSIVKTAFAMAFDMGMSPKACEVAVRCLHSNAGTPAWSAFHERDLVINRPPRQITHTVSVRANPESETILAYVEYFSAFRYVVDLSHKYAGPAVQKTIAFDPVTWLPVDLDIDLALSPDEYARMLEGTWSSADWQKSFNYALPIALEALDRRQLNNEIAQAIRDGFETLGVSSGGELPQAKFQEFSRIVSRRLTEYAERVPRRFGVDP